MSKRFRHVTPAFLQLASVLLAASPSLAGWGTANKDYGGSLNMQLYTPSQVAASPAILVAIHYCTGTASSTHGWFDSAADKNGFYIIAPDAGKQCFDSSATRAGDRADIVKMVQYVITQKNADKSRVFSAGLSSGGCMTNTLLAIYPDVFAGGSAMPGFPAGAWPAGDTTCSKCGSTPPNNTAKQWGDMARNAFAYSGTRPCVQEWVGGGDEYNFNGWLPSVAAQFTDLMGLGSGSSGTGAPSGWTRTVYKDTAGSVRLETNLGPASQKHDLSSAGLFGYVISFLGLDKPTGSCGNTSVGGATSTGGGTGTGGATGSGGNTNTGGKAAGGTSSGGGNATGGISSSTGGKAAGGASSAGGSSVAGATSGGATTTSGGASSANGGSANGGSANGGASATNGGTASGGASTPPAGGSATVLSGGVTGAGGASTSTSGGATTGAAGAATGGSGGTDAGCSCSTGIGHEQNIGLAGLVGLALCAGLRARKRTRSRRA